MLRPFCIRHQPALRCLLYHSLPARARAHIVGLPSIGSGLSSYSDQKLQVSSIMSQKQECQQLTSTSGTGQPSTQALGCSRCRFAAGGCSRCRKLGFKPRSERSGTKRERPPSDKHDGTGDSQKLRRQAVHTRSSDAVALPKRQRAMPEMGLKASNGRDQTKRGSKDAQYQLHREQREGSGEQQQLHRSANLAQVVRQRLGRRRSNASSVPVNASAPYDELVLNQQQHGDRPAAGAGSASATYELPDGISLGHQAQQPSQQEVVREAPHQQPQVSQPVEQQTLGHTNSVVALPDQDETLLLAHSPTNAPQEGQLAQPPGPSSDALTAKDSSPAQAPASFMQLLQERMDKQRQQSRDPQRQQLLLTPQKAAQVGRSPANTSSPAVSMDRAADAVGFASTAAGRAQAAEAQSERQQQLQGEEKQQQEQQKQHKQRQQELQQQGAPLAVDQHVQDDVAMTEVLLAEAAATPTTSGSGRSNAAATPDTGDATQQGKGKAKKKRKPQPKPPKKGAYAHLHTAGDPDPRIATWVPPQSPYCLLEEELYEDPWRTLLACMLLNKTTGKQVRSVIWRLFELCPTPEAAVAADVAAIQDIIYPLGFFRKRAIAVQRFSDDYLTKQWTCPTELHGIGKYAADAYYIFCRGRWEGIVPDDKDLKKYHAWLQSTGGQGAGLERTSPHKQHRQQGQEQPETQVAAS